MKKVGITLDERFKNLKTDVNGLSSIEAGVRLNQYGPNMLSQENKLSAWRLLAGQFKSSLIYLLLIACLISISLRDITDASVIAVILVINTGMGFFQEYKSEKAIDNLQKLVSRQSVVLRDKEEMLLDEVKLVPGDVIIIKEGDIVPADAQLIHTDDLAVDEAALTGESVAVNKTLASGNNLVYAGSTVVQGEAKALVYATAAETKLGNIAHLSSSTKRTTQYEHSLTEFSTFLIKTTFITLIIVFLAKIMISGDVHHLAPLALFMIALSIAVVPEAMPVIATVTLSSGALKLAKQHVIAKTLSSVEDLGNITVLCSDKTGTLTENRQSVVDLIAADKELFLYLAANSLESRDIKRRHLSSFDQAFVDYIPSSILEKVDSVKRLEELPFDPLARRRRIVFQNGNKTYLVVVGSVETLLDLTKSTKKEAYTKIITDDGKKGLRHLGIAYKQVEYAKDFDIVEHEKGLKFAGFVSIEDKLRPSAKHTIDMARKLGVSIKILSGDSREVTGYVAHEVGLIADNQPVFTGEKIAAMSDLELADIVEHNNVFARLDPGQKYRIIKVLQVKGQVVGYQGDGINDAPSLKLADVAIAVNHATDVARDSADILLLQDDLGVIVNGIRYGRGIFANINKYIRYTMVGNFGNFFALAALFLLSTQLPLLTLQLLLTNLLSDIPLIAISTDNVDPLSLLRPSRYNMHALIFLSVVLGSYTAIFEILFYAMIKNRPVSITQTALYLFLTLIGFVVILAVRNRQHFWQAVPISRPIKWAFLAVAVISIAVIYLPLTKRLFSFTQLPGSVWLITIAMTLFYFFFLDMIKVWFYKTAIASKSE